MASLLVHYLNIWQPFAYAFIFLGMIFEGEIVLFAVFFLVHQGYFDLRYLLPVVLVGVVVGDLLWYEFGFYQDEKDSSLVRWINKIVGPFDGHLISNPERTIFMSKFIYGIHHALLLRAGMLKVNQRKFIKADISAALIWVSITSAIGYFSGVSFVLIKKYFHFAELFLLALIILFVFLNWVISSRLKRRL